MSIFTVVSWCIGLIGFIALMTSAVIVAKSTTKNTTIDSLKELNDTLLKERQIDKEQLAKNTADIATLQGQVEVLKNIPLEKMATDLNSVAIVQLEILNLLKNK